MLTLFNRLPKPLLFGICAAVGCLVAALFGEILLAFTLPAPVTAQQVDVLFVLDVTGSMESEINGVKTGIRNFVSELEARQLDARVGAIAFGDRFQGEEPQILSFGGQSFTADTDSFSREVSRIKMVHGGDDPESSLDALVLGARQPFRADSTKVMLLITDAPAKIPDRETSSMSEAVRVLGDQKIDQLHLAIQDSDRSAFASLQTAAPGEIFSLAETAAERQGFERVLPEVGKQIAAAITTEKISPEKSQSLIAVTSLWTGVLAIGAFLALIVGQNRYLRRRVLTIRQGVTGTLGSVAAGLVAGAGGQLLYVAVPSLPVFEAIGRILAWTILGVLLGLGMAFFIPNSKPGRVPFGGGLGGAIGAIGFLWAAGAFGDIAGRLFGAAILGFFIGLMIALIEELVRNAWLVVHWGPRESSTIGLGTQPVILGSSEQAHIYLPQHQGFQPVVATIRFTTGRILYRDQQTGQEQTLRNGSEIKIGSLTIQVRTKI